MNRPLGLILITLLLASLGCGGSAEKRGGRGADETSLEEATSEPEHVARNPTTGTRQGRAMEVDTERAQEAGREVSPPSVEGQPRNAFRSAGDPAQIEVTGDERRYEGTSLERYRFEVEASPARPSLEGSNNWSIVVEPPDGQPFSVEGTERWEVEVSPITPADVVPNITHELDLERPGRLRLTFSVRGEPGPYRLRLTLKSGDGSPLTAVDLITQL